MPQKYYGVKNCAEGGLASKMSHNYHWMLEFKVTLYIFIWYLK